MDAKTKLKLMLEKRKRENESAKEGKETDAPVNVVNEIEPVVAQQKDETVDERDPNPIFDMIKMLKIAQDEKLPDFHTRLRDIHLHMAKDPETVTILTDEEIGIIVSGLKEVQNNVQLAAPKSSVKKRLPVTADML